MEGRIKFVDAKTQKWGYIVPPDKSADVYFKIEDFIGPRHRQLTAMRRFSSNSSSKAQTERPGASSCSFHPPQLPQSSQARAVN